MPKAYSYIRFSTPEQAKGDSLPRQIRLAENYAQMHGLDLVSDAEMTFFDAGRSAYKGMHLDDGGQLKRFLDFVEDGSIEPGSYLLIESLDRLSREKVNVALPRFMDILNKGIRIVTLSDERVYDQNFNEMELIISIVIMSRAHNESSEKANRIKSAWRRKQTSARDTGKPLGGAHPAWIELHKETYRLIPERAAVVRRIFELTINGYGRDRIVKLLNSEGVPVFTSPKRNTKRQWGDSTIQKILCSRSVIGEYQPYLTSEGRRIPAGAPIQGYYPSVVDEDVFYSALASVRERRICKSTRQSTSFNVWQGIALCSKCDSSMHLINKGKPPKGSTYLQCSSARHGVCSGKLIRLDVAEKALPEILVKIGALALIRSNDTRLRGEALSTQGRISELSKKLGDQKQLIKEFPSRAAFEVLQELEEDIGKLEDKLFMLNAELMKNSITDKHEFFSKIDLISYEGRARANSLMKRLGFKVWMSRQTKEEEDFPIYLQCHVHRPGENLMKDGFTILLMNPDSPPEFNTMSKKYAGLAVDQKDIEQVDFDDYEF